MHALRLEPSRIIRPRHDDNLSCHRRMLKAAKLGALEPEDAGLLGLEPDRLERTGNDVVLDPEGWNEEAVNDVLRRHHQPDDLVDWNMQCVDLTLTARMLHLPHPLLADDIDLLVGRRRLEEPGVDLRTPDKENEKHAERGDRPGYFEMPGLFDPIGPRSRTAAAISDVEDEHH